MKTDIPADKAWRVSDLIDLEYFLRQETEEKPGIESDSAATAHGRHQCQGKEPTRIRRRLDH